MNKQYINKEIHKMVNFIIIKMPIEIIAHLQIHKNSDAKHTIEAVKSKPSYMVLIGINNDTTSMEDGSIISIKITNAFILF